MQWVRYLLFMMICLTGCSSQNHEGSSPDASDVPRPTAAAPADLNGIELAESDSGMLHEEDLYGKFFQERAVFYVIDQPDQTIYNCSVNELTVCYLDQQVAQMKYVLAGNPVNDLLRTHKKASIRIMGCDSLNKQILKASRPVIPTPDGYAFNPQLDNYLLRWVLADKDVVLRVRPGRIEYTERVKNYSHEFKAIEAIAGG